jgi:oligoribonuclease NrnB/cAMP/cGMP phosphodiesterase (DHH superfamily)
MTDLERRPLVIYHSDCFDGFCAAWVFRCFKGDDVEYHPGRYGDDPPDCKGRRVWLLDFSYPRDVLIEKVILPSIQTTIYDHHKTAEADLAGINDDLWKRGVQRGHDRIVFDMHRSGAGITWDELEHERGVKRGRHEPRYNEQRKDRLVDYIEDRDIWRFRYANSKEISAYISTVPMTFENYDALNAALQNAEGFERCTYMGRAVLDYIEIYGDKSVKSARIETVGGYEVPTMNIQYMNSSEHIGKLAEAYPDHLFAVGYYRRSDGKWHFGLRSRGDFDCSQVAKQYGGGGHPGASGFHCDRLPWEPPPSTPHYIVDPEVFEEVIKKPTGIIEIGKPSLDATGPHTSTEPTTGKVSTIEFGDNSVATVSDEDEGDCEGCPDEDEA